MSDFIVTLASEIPFVLHLETTFISLWRTKYNWTHSSSRNVIFSQWGWHIIWNCKVTSGKMKGYASLFNAIFVVLIGGEASQDGRYDLTNNNCQRLPLSLSCTLPTAFWHQAPCWFFTLQWFQCLFVYSMYQFILLNCQDVNLTRKKIVLFDACQSIWLTWELGEVPELVHVASQGSRTYLRESVNN